MKEEYQRLSVDAREAIPKLPPPIIPWAEQNVVFPSSARSKHFNVSITPWIKEPLERAIDNETRIITCTGAVQSGKSTLGEVVILYWIMFWRNFLQYNWPTEDRAAERWKSRIRGILESCAPVKQRMDALPRFDDNQCEIDFGNVFFRMQGVFNPNRLDSDSIRLQINEEVHDWKPGFLNKARNRSTAIWNFKSIDISNSGKKNDQLDQAVQSGTMQYWLNKCPCCGKWHRIRTRFDKRRPDLGGLRYDADDSRRSDGTYDYNKIRSTVRLLLPCGFPIRDNPSDRRSLSLAGSYPIIENTGAELSNRSYIGPEAVAVDYIDWMQLIKDKHVALRARKYGDIEPWRRYVSERENTPYNPDDVPLAGKVIVIQGQKKNRDGLADPKLRLFALDRQQGEKYKNEFPYWWLLIRDFKIEGDKIRSLLVYEARLDTDDQVIAALNEHKCNRWQGVADSGDDTTHVYLFCLQNGINAIKGGREEFFLHKDGSRKIFSPERPLHAMINRPPVYPYIQTKKGLVPDPREPLFWLYAKAGIRERLNWMRTSSIFETPSDVSEDYQSHMEAEDREPTRNARTGEETFIWVQKRTRNDQFVNECYCAMQVDMAGWIGEGFLKQQQSQQNKK